MWIAASPPIRPSPCSISWPPLAARPSTSAATRSSATRTPGTRIVVLPRLRCCSPEIPASHQPLHAPAPDPDAVPHPQLGVHARCPVDLPVRLPDLADLLEQPRVRERPVSGCAPGPGVVARARDAEQLTSDGDRRSGLLGRDHPVDRHRVSVSAAKKAAARLSRSRSCSRRLTFLRSSRNSHAPRSSGRHRARAHRAGSA
jgi:hypothetical protein